MSLEYDDEETDRLLAAADDIDFVGQGRRKQQGISYTGTYYESASYQQSAPPTSYWALQRLQRLKLLRALQGWHPVKGATGNCVGERAFARGPLSLFQMGGSADIFHRIGREATTRLKKPVISVDAGSVAGLLAELVAIASRR